MKIIRKYSVALLTLLAAIGTADLQAAPPVAIGVGDYQTAPPVAIGAGDIRPQDSVSTEGILPNMHAKSLTTPVAWGAAYGTVFAGAAIDNRGPYFHGTPFTRGVGDGAVAVGLGIGNPVENLGFQAVLTQYEIRLWNRYGMSFQVHRYLGSASAVAVGVQDVMLSKGSDTGRSYYIVYSKGVLASPFIDTTRGTTRLHYSVGAGNGLFANKNQGDILAGKGEKGTYIFGNVAYELFNSFNVITDWNGINLNAGISKTFLIKNSIPIVITAGAADLTSFSGDGVRFIFGVGTGITL